MCSITPRQAESGSPVWTVTDQLEVPSLDDRQYRVIRLRNGLEALIVHDPETDKASAALDVNVGNYSDDTDWPGTAHAVEHFLFMGTKKYPEENAYNAYLSAHSGSSNAYTAGTSTNFFFDISANPTNGEKPSATNPSPLYGGLDRFAQFFIEPLFLSSTLDRELRAVDSEHKKNLQNDQWRLHQLEKFLSNNKHPYSHFSTGNLEVLKTIPEARGFDVRQKFMDFHAKYYSANIMKLCVLGAEPLDVLETWVADLFSGIPNKNLPQNRWEKEVPFPDEYLAYQCFAKPIMDSRDITLTFPFLDEEMYYESRPSGYISHLIGHEGPGSIMAHLKAKGWANSLSAGAYPICPGTPGIFDCQIHLTQEGLKNYKEVVKVFFQYVSLLRRIAPQQWIYDEQREMGEVEFKYRQKSPASRFTSKMCSTMQMPLPREWLLSGSRLRKFDAKMIERGIGFLRPDNLRMFVVSREFPGNWDKTERWYGTEYKAEKISKDFLNELWVALASSPPADQSPMLSLPHANLFIPTKLEVERKEVEKPAISPRVIRSDMIARIWWKKDDRFWVPKASFIVSMQNPICYSSAKNTVMLKLYTDLVRDALDEYSYDADIAGLRYDVGVDARGLLVQVSGYSDKLADLAEQVVKTMRDLVVKNDRFEIIKERASRAYKNSELVQPYHQAAIYLTWLIMEQDYIVEQLSAELPSITIDDVRCFHKDIISQMRVEAYAHGNLYKEDALKLTDMVETILKPRILRKEEWSIMRNLILPPGSNYLYRRTLSDPANVNHCIEYYLHVGDKGDRTIRAKSMLLEQFLHEPAFDRLRTKEQLGYIVFTGVRSSVTTYGLRFLIQSERPCEYLESRIDLFLQAQALVLRDMTDETFESHKRSVIAKRLEKVKSLDQECMRHWSSISSGYYDFEAHQKDADRVEKLTKDEMIEFFWTHIDPKSPTRAKMVIQLEAQGVSPKSKKANGDEATDKEQAELPTNGTEPVLITDVWDYKSKLVATGGPRPIRDLTEYEELDSKL
ncbi:peptidase M16 inactive domain-containing protein [Xylaria nigripes]|nr:peptidase M16 inactive domain-containing protein [Xylaria nigripes]